MRWFFLTLITVLCFVIFCYHNVDGFADQLTEKITGGLAAGQKSSEVMKVLNAFEWVKKISQVALPLMTVAVTAIELILSFVLKESLQLKLMKEQFASINDRLDAFSIKFAEVKRKIEWSAIQISFDKYEKNVHILNADRVRLTNLESTEAMELQKESFIRKYENYGSLISEHLYAAMSTSSILSNNLFEAARKYTQNHHTLTFEFIKGSIQLLIQAYSIDVTYLTLKHNNSEVLEIVTKRVEDNIKNVQANAMKINEKIVKELDRQMRSDVHKEIILARGTSNEYLSKYLYNYLDDKFPWRQWFVLTYNYASDSRKHASMTCGGAKFVNTGNRNVVVSSTEKKEKTQFTKAWAETQFNKVSSFRVTEKYAEQVLDKFLPYNENCRPAAVIAAVRGKDHRNYVADAQVYTDRSRLFLKNFCSYKCNTRLCWVKKQKCFTIMMWG